MKKESLTLLNTAALLALSAGGGLYLFLNAGCGPGEGVSAAQEPAVASPITPSPTRLGELEVEVAKLRAQVAQLEASVALERPSPRPSQASQPHEESEPTGSSAPASTAPLASRAESSSIERAEVKVLIAGVLDERRKARDARRAQAAAKAKKPKRTLSQVTQELALTPQQSTTIQSHLEDLEGESMRILFALQPEANLLELQAQLEQSKHDPALTEKLRETVAINWTRNQKEFWVLYVKLDAKLRKVLPKETLAKFYRYDVSLDAPNYPDMETFFDKKEQ